MDENTGTDFSSFFLLCYLRHPRLTTCLSWPIDPTIKNVPFFYLVEFPVGPSAKFIQVPIVIRTA